MLRNAIELWLAFLAAILITGLYALVLRPVIFSVIAWGFLAFC
jgi:hypothetical protein